MGKCEIIIDKMTVSLTVRDDVDGLVVHVKQAEKTAPRREQGPVPGQDVRVELKMRWHLVPFQEADFTLHHLHTSPAGAILIPDYP